MKKKISLEEVKHIAKLANLPLSDSEIKKLATQLTSVIDFNVSLLNKVSTEGVEPTAHVSGAVNSLMAQEAEPGLDTS